MSRQSKFYEAAAVMTKFKVARLLFTNFQFPKVLGKKQNLGGRSGEKNIMTENFGRNPKNKSEAAAVITKFKVARLLFTNF